MSPTALLDVGFSLNACPKCLNVFMVTVFAESVAANAGRPLYCPYCKSEVRIESPVKSDASPEDKLVQPPADDPGRANIGRAGRDRKQNGQREVVSR